MTIIIRKNTYNSNRINVGTPPSNNINPSTRLGSQVGVVEGANHPHAHIHHIFSPVHGKGIQQDSNSSSGGSGYNQWIFQHNIQGGKKSKVSVKIKDTADYIYSDNMEVYSSGAEGNEEKVNHENMEYILEDLDSLLRCHIKLHLINT